MPTRFQTKVWNLLKKIPKGKVTTYKAIAKALNSKAYRAVGNACNKNPYSPKVPCHRVVNSNGSIGGYATGIKKKIALLKKEVVFVKGKKIADFKKKMFTL
jgi:methylated-DNA-[protein]-cysteine S-methyltransferase